MIIDNLSQRIIRLSQRIEELRQQHLSDPASSAKVLADVLEELQGSIEELSSADEELMQQKEETASTEEALRRSEEKYRTIVETANEGIWIVDAELQTTYVNNKMAKMLGYSPEEMIGRSGLGFIDDEGKAHSDLQVKNMRRGIEESHEFKLIRKDGMPLWAIVNAQPLFDRSGKFAGALNMLTDITERKRMQEALQEKQEELEAQAEELRAQNEELNANNEELSEVTKRLQESEERFRATFEQAAVGIEMLDLDGRFLRGNAMLGKILGYSEKELLDLNFADITHPEDLARELPMLEDMLAGRIGNYTIEKRYLRKDDQNVWVRVTSSLAYTQEAYRIAIIEDITERKKTEEKLERSNQKINEILNSIQDDFYVLDRDWNFVYASKPFTSRIGEEPEDFIGNNIWKMFLKHIGTAFEENLRASMDKREIRRFEVGGKYTNAHYRMAVFPSEEGITVLGTDITEQKRAEEALKESEQHYRLLFETMLQGVVYQDADGTILSMNPAAERILGKTQEEFLGSSSVGQENFTIREDGSPFPGLEHPAMVALKTGQEVRNVAMGVYNPRMNCCRWININAVPLFRPGEDKPYQAYTIFDDITDRKGVEEALQKAKDELEVRVRERTAELSNAKENLEVINEKLQVEISGHEKTEKDLFLAKEAAEAAAEAKAAFLANMSHELRTPLNAVIGFSSLLLEDNLTEDQKEYIERIRNGGEALLSVLSDILEFSRAEKEKIALEHQQFNLERAIEESMDMVAAQAEEKCLNMAYTIAYGTPDTIIGDPGRLRQVLVNLLSNAVKFTDAGDISVSISSQAAEGNRRQIQFAVKDTGMGMPKDKMGRLFKPFTQLEYTISRKRDGVGLGLAICKRLVELMGGNIWAESEEGKGSTFWFTILAEAVPGRYLEPVWKDRAEYENLSDQKPLSILIAEDNPSNQRVLVEMLKRLGYRADAVASGVEAIQALQNRPYDLVLMDIRMPEMDGLTATKEIRKLWPDKGPKVVAITAFAMDGDQKKCLEAGMDGYIAKPVKVDDLAILLLNIAAQENNKI